MISINEKTWIISDTHWSHGNIVRYAKRPPNHDHLMFQNWMEPVSYGDTVLHLGDLMWNSSSFKDKLKQLPGNKFIILGNHDTMTKSFFRKVGFEPLDSQLMETLSTNDPYDPEKKVKVFYSIRPGWPVLAFSHYPLRHDATWDLNLHGHVHRETRPGRRWINCCVEVRDYKPTRLGDLLNGYTKGISSTDGERISTSPERESINS